MSQENGEIINFYTTSRIKKKLPKTKDLQKAHTQMKIDSRFLIAGASGTGKNKRFDELHLSYWIS